VANQILLSWTALEGFALERANALPAASSWTAITNAPGLTNGVKTLGVTNSSQAEFFRLVRP
jgi:hypothetical protein